MQNRIQTVLAISSVVVITTAGATTAGSGNNASVLQETPVTATTGNSLRIDQTAADGSIVAGVELTGADLDSENVISGIQDDNGDAPDATEFFELGTTMITSDMDGGATQSGIGNAADITVGENGKVVGLRQTQTGGNEIGEYNKAVITANSGKVLLLQDGDRNDATLSTSDSAALASLLQDGDDNTASVNVSGTDSQGILAQIGDGNATDLNVDTAGASVSFTVQGNNTSATLPASVVSSAGGGQITIIQRPLGGQ
jgi:hypothetical protein